MKQATLSKVRSRAKAYFDLVESGESVRVLRNGKPIANMVTVTAELPPWKRRKAQPLVISGVSPSKAIPQGRDLGAQGKARCESSLIALPLQNVTSEKKAQKLY